MHFCDDVAKSAQRNRSQSFSNLVSHSRVVAGARAQDPFACLYTLWQMRDCTRPSKWSSSPPLRMFLQAERPETPARPPGATPGGSSSRESERRSGRCRGTRTGAPGAACTRRRPPLKTTPNQICYIIFPPDLKIPKPLKTKLVI